MKFYEQISRYYDQIFPPSQETLDFYKKIFEENHIQSVLDIACGSGSYLNAFAQWGLDTLGIDLDPSMVALANQKAVDSGSTFQAVEGDMMKAADYATKPFDAVVCMGNSLVHLNSIEDMAAAVKGFYQSTRPGGLCIIQIVNYDRILDQHITELPPITDSAVPLNFIRKYAFDTAENKIRFHTRLTVKGEDYENEILLYPLRREELKRVLEEAGYANMDFFGNFKGQAWNDDAFSTIVTAKKA